MRNPALGANIVALILVIAAPLEIRAQQRPEPPSPGFDVASIKPADSAARGDGTWRGGPGTADPGRIVYGRSSLKALLMRAYGLKDDQVKGPDWIADGNVNSFTVSATMPPETSESTFRLMLQNLLVERFHLVLHRETKYFPGYELIVGDQGPRLNAAPNDSGEISAPRSRTGRGAATQLDKRGFPVLLPGMTFLKHGPRLGTWGLYRASCRQSMSEFTAVLPIMIRESKGDPADSPSPYVADRTGLVGEYDFTIEFAGADLFGDAPLMSRAQSSPLNDRDALNPADVGDAQRVGGGGPTLFEALEKQLGLKLHKVKDVPIEVLVIDHADKTPVEN